jgi:hypothetical protein
MKNLNFINQCKNAVKSILFPILFKYFLPGLIKLVNKNIFFVN